MTLTTADLAPRLQTIYGDALDSFNAGFSTIAAKKAAIGGLNRVYEAIHEAAHDEAISQAYEAHPNAETEGEYRARAGMINHLFADAPFGLHQVRERHIEAIDRLVGAGDILRELIALRAAMNAAEVVRVERVASVEERIVRSIKDEMERRKTQFLEAYDLTSILDGKVMIEGVTANAHYVTNQYGTTFLRVFYYLRGKLTPLAVIVAAAQKKAMDQAGAQ